MNQSERAELRRLADCLLVYPGPLALRMADHIDALEAEVARLRGENAALKKQVEGPTNTRFNDWLLASHTPPEHGEK